MDVWSKGTLKPVVDPRLQYVLGLLRGKILASLTNGASLHIQRVTVSAWRSDFRKHFRKSLTKNLVLHILRTPWQVQDDENCALSKFHSPTTLGESQTVQNPKQKNLTFCRFFSASFRPFVRPGSARQGSDRARTRRMARKL